MPATDRSPAEIRASIEKNREELAVALDKLRGEVKELTDWRKQLTEHQTELIAAAAAAGFLLGGGLAGVIGIATLKRLRNRRKRRRW